MRGICLMLTAVLTGTALAHPLQSQQDGLVIENDRIVAEGVISEGVLVLVDGVTVASSSIPQIALSTIERIEIIRGAAAVGLYGTRAAEGAILITTTSPLQAVSPSPESGIRIGTDRTIVWNQVPQDVVITLDGRESTISEVAGLGADEIEQIEVIRGAAAEQQYGARAAGGVIRVTSRAPAVSMPEEPGIRIDSARSVTLDNLAPGILLLLDGQVSSSSAIEALGEDEIESIEVIRGAAALSLYGNRASEGVILVTTRTGGTR